MRSLLGHSRNHQEISSMFLNEPQSENTKRRLQSGQHYCKWLIKTIWFSPGDIFNVPE